MKVLRKLGSGAYHFEIEVATHMSSKSAAQEKLGPAQRPEKKTRLAQPPYMNLAEAVRAAEQIYEQGGGRADKNLLTVILKNSTSSSSFTRKLQSLRWYQLTAGMVPPVTLTEVALGIVAPKDEYSRLAALKSAAIGPDQFRRTYERLKGKLLPQMEFLVNGFQHDLSVPKAIATAWAESFVTALETANLLLQRPDGKIQVLEGAAARYVDAEPAVEVFETPPVVSEGTPPDRSASHQSNPNEGHTTRIALSEGRIAIFSIPDRLSKKDASRLKGAIGGISAIIDSMIDEEDGF